MTSSFFWALFRSPIFFLKSLKEVNEMKTGLFGVLAFTFLGFAHFWGLRIAPPDAMMGDVYRILFVHVPAAWMAMLFFFFSFVGSAGYLIRRQKKWDRWAESTAEIGVVLTALTLILGSMWGKPTWGVWWTWDPRLTTTALLLIMYSGYLMIRKMITDPERRPRVAASIGLLTFLNVPIVYLSVKWWRSLHQVQSSPKTMDPSMVFPLRLCAVALLAVCLCFLFLRLKISKQRALIEEGGPK
ncbi:MAG: cytochrome c biogenesis protein CcsA [Deltaproteobacteria bacterium]|nr:cytochrome c biogenesis protein CcsA [Deltaproteobacteria bacterium]MBI4373925.1 cytochrome c biogenesis protein CcsA [Deltaproteobacteria bacterium]